jgi:hypothetical protein
MPGLARRASDTRGQQVENTTSRRTSRIDQAIESRGGNELASACSHKSVRSDFGVKFKVLLGSEKKTLRNDLRFLH